MHYRQLGKTGLNVSVLGFGAMRFPMTAGGPAHAVDEPEAIRMLRHAIDEGVNYVDTAYIYHHGDSEVITGKALRDGYRDKALIATKSPVWMIHQPSDFDKYLDEQLRRLDTDVIDLYLLHGLSHDRWHEVVLKHGLIERAEAALRQGKIRHLGFSFHDGYEGFEEVINGYDKWEFCQIQYNYMDMENQAGERGLKLAAEHGLGIVIMEPLLGGRLANPPRVIRDAMERSSNHRTPVDWALQWLWELPEVSTVLSGMSTMQQLQENLASASQSVERRFSGSDQEIIAFARAEYLKRTVIPCTKCGYCLPCPNGVDIPSNFEMYNDGHLYDDMPGAKFRYSIFLDPDKRADVCNNCEDCLSKCPQNIAVNEWLVKVAEALG